MLCFALSRNIVGDSILLINHKTNETVTIKVYQRDGCGKRLALAIDAPDNIEIRRASRPDKKPKISD